VVAACCPRCHGEFQVSAALFGQQAVCPMCRHSVVVAPAGAEPEPASAPPASQPSPSASTKANCPHCSAEFAIHSAQPLEEVTCPVCLKHIGMQKEPSEGVEALPTEQYEPDPEDSSSTADKAAGESGEFAVRDEPRTVQVGHRVVELHSRSRKEKNRLRFRKNIFMLMLGVAVLVISLAYLGGAISPGNKTTNPADETAAPERP